MRTVRFALVLVFCAAAGTMPGAGQDSRKPAGELPEIKELPDPFTFADGTRVRTEKDWQRRRAKGKVPVIIQSSFGFGKKGGAASGKRFTTFTSRGYAVAEFSFNQVASDNKDKARTTGIYQLFGDQIDTGALMAWAWGVARVID